MSSKYLVNCMKTWAEFRRYVWSRDRPFQNLDTKLPLFRGSGIHMFSLASQVLVLWDHCVCSGHVHNMPLQCVGVLSVYLATILYCNHQLFFDTERENIRCSIICVSLLEISATINLYYLPRGSIQTSISSIGKMMSSLSGTSSSMTSSSMEAALTVDWKWTRLILRASHYEEYKVGFSLPRRSAKKWHHFVCSLKINWKVLNNCKGEGAFLVYTRKLRRKNEGICVNVR